MHSRAFTRRQILVGAAAVGLSLTFSCGPLPAPHTDRVARIGLLALKTEQEIAQNLDVLRSGLRDVGWTTGQNLWVVERYANGRSDVLPDLTRELLDEGVDLIVTDSTPATVAAMNITRSVPIVFTNSSDPLGEGLVSRLARPGGNVTGLSSLNRELAGKRLELLKAAVPSVSRICVVWADAAQHDLLDTTATAPALGLDVS